MTSSKWPDWAKPAQKGDAIRLAVWQKSAVNKLASAVLALSNNDTAKATRLISEYIKETEELDGIIDDVGGA